MMSTNISKNTNEYGLMLVTTIACFIGVSIGSYLTLNQVRHDDNDRWTAAMSSINICTEDWSGSVLPEHVAKCDRGTCHIGFEYPLNVTFRRQWAVTGGCGSYPAQEEVSTPFPTDINWSTKMIYSIYRGKL
jgi:hypothetical protein